MFVTVLGFDFEDHTTANPDPSKRVASASAGSSLNLTGHQHDSYTHTDRDIRSSVFKEGGRERMESFR